jgi:hypothetical protein
MVDCASMMGKSIKTKEKYFVILKRLIKAECRNGQTVTSESLAVHVWLCDYLRP